MVFGKQNWSEMEITRNGNKYFINVKCLRQSIFLNAVVSLTNPRSNLTDACIKISEPNKFIFQFLSWLLLLVISSFLRLFSPDFAQCQRKICTFFISEITSCIHSCFLFHLMSLFWFLVSLHPFVLSFLSSFFTSI